jgi:hypothetical protein
MLWRVKYAVIRRLRRMLEARKDRLSDETFARLKYLLTVERLPRFRNPRYFKDHVNALKLWDRNPVRALVADKLAVRDFVRQRVGEEYLTALHGQWARAGDIAFDGLPQRFVLKANHGSAMVRVVLDRGAEDLPAVREECARWLQTDFSAVQKEWVYRDIPRRVFAEQYLSDGTNPLPLDYKFYVFSGRCGAVHVDVGRPSRHQRATFDRDFNLLPYRNGFPVPPPGRIARPENFDEMRSVAEALGRDFSFIRVDLYSVHGRVYFGELTNFPDAGFKSMDEALDRFLGECWRRGRPEGSPGLA